MPRHILLRTVYHIFCTLQMSEFLFRGGILRNVGENIKGERIRAGPAVFGVFLINHFVQQFFQHPVFPAGRQDPVNIRQGFRRREKSAVTVRKPPFVCKLCGKSVLFPPDILNAFGKAVTAGPKGLHIVNAAFQQIVQTFTLLPERGDFFFQFRGGFLKECRAGRTLRRDSFP